MSVTVTLVKDCGPVGAGYEAIVDLTGDASYATGGEALAAAELQSMMPRLSKGEILADAASCAKVQSLLSERSVSGHEVTLDRTNVKLLFWAAGAEAANLANLSAVTVRARVRYGQVT